MVITPHAVTGTLIAINCEIIHVRNQEQYPRRLVILILCMLAFCSHFLLDSLPHYDYSIYTNNKTDNIVKVMFDLALALAISVFLLKKPFQNLIQWLRIPVEFHGLSLAKQKMKGLPVVFMALTGIFMAIIPDVVAVLSRYFGILNGYRKFHDYFHASSYTDIVSGSIAEIFVTLILILLNIKSAKRLENETRLKTVIEEINGEMCIYFGKKK